MNNVYSALAHRLYNQNIPILVIHRQHDQFDKELRYHSHDFMELVVVTGGSAVHSIKRQNEEAYSYKISQGFAFIINIGDVHTYTFSEDEYLTVENIIFDPTILTHLKVNVETERDFTNFIYQLPLLPMEIRFSKTPLLNSQQFDKISKLFDILNHEQQHDDLAGSTSIQLLLLNLMLLYMNRAYTSIGAQMSMEQPKNGGMSVTNLVGYIQQHYCEDLTLGRLAEFSHYGERHLSREFKKITGNTITEYIRHLRISKACSLLQNTDLKINEIASRVGIPNSSLFGKTFRQITNMTPTEFRGMDRKEQQKPHQ